MRCINDSFPPLMARFVLKVIYYLPTFTKGVMARWRLPCW